MNVWAIHRELNSSSVPLCSAGEAAPETLPDELHWDASLVFEGIDSLVDQFCAIRPTEHVDTLVINAHGMPGAMRLGGSRDMLTLPSIATYGPRLARIGESMLRSRPRGSRGAGAPTIILGSCAVASEDVGRQFCELISSWFGDITLVAFTSLLETGGVRVDSTEGTTSRACRVPRLWITDETYDRSEPIEQQGLGSSLSCAAGATPATGCSMALPRRRNARHFFNGDMVWPEERSEPHAGRRRTR